MKKILNIVLKLLGIIAFVALIPPLVNWIVSKPSVIGFITLDKQEAWINFYGALIGGMLTLLGVGWTIKHTDSLNKEEQRKREQEIKEEYNRRDIETKNNLSAQFRPILTISCDSDFIDDNKFGMSKHKHFYYQNTIGIFDKEKINEEAKRIVISLELLNIGRGEASDLTINSVIRQIK